LPEINDENRHFWQGGQEDKLNFLHCPQCAYFVHPPAPVCPKCYQRQLEVKAVSGRAVVASYTINHQQWLPGLDVPYLIAIVEIDDQPELRLTTNIVNCAMEKVYIGMPVTVVFEQREDVWLPLFEPVTGEAV
jgi:uncharacterized OB-fold protein